MIWIYWFGACLGYAAYDAFLHGVEADTFEGAITEIVTDGAAFSVALWWVPLAIAGTWFLVAWVWYARLIRVATGARSVSRREEQNLYNLVENLAITAGLPMPRIEVMETNALNAYAAGLTPRSATIAVTRGLLQRLTKQELEAVLAHEMTHIKNFDVSLMVIALIFSGGITLLGDMVGRFVTSFSGHEPSHCFWWPRYGFGGDSGAGDDDNDASWIAVAAGIAIFFVAIVLMGMAHVFAILNQLAISRSREYMADAGAVELTKNPDALISALARISGHDALPLASEGLRAMMISRTENGDGFLETLFSTHPPVSARITSLERYAGGRVRSAPRRRPSAYCETSDRVQSSPRRVGPMPTPGAISDRRPALGSISVTGARANFGRRV